MKIYIYTLEDPTTGQIRYVGRTKNSLSRRLSDHISNTKSNHGTHKLNWIRKLNRSGLKPIIRILDELECSWEDSHDIEKYWIAQLYCWGFKLTNCADKGLGSLDRPYFGQSDKAILQYDMSGKLIREWKSARDASRAGGFDWKKISACCNNSDNRKSHKGYMWVFRDSDYVIEPYIRKSKSKPVYQYTRNNVLIKYWNSTKEAAQYFGVPSGRIVSVANGNWPTYANYKWSYVKLD